MRPAGHLLLIADDDPNDRQLLRSWLSYEDDRYRIHEIDSAAATIEACRTLAVGCLILDHHFPDGTALEVLDRLTAGGGIAPFPVVVVTGQGDEALAVQALKRGAMDYIVKGATSQDGLRETVAEAISRFEGRPELDRRRAELERDYGATGLSSPARQRLILILDDSRQDRELARRSLTRAGQDYRFIEEADPAEGLSLCRSAGLDCLLLDYSLPGDDGLAFLEQLTGGTGIPPFPIVMLTGRGDYAIAAQALKRGAVDYLIKGTYGPGELRDTVRQAIDRQSARRLAEEERVRELDRLEREARHRAEQLAAADRSKDQFLAMLAHELRNPMAPISNAHHIIRKSAALPEVATKALDVAERQLKHLSRLVDDLMEVSRITRGRITFDMQRVEVGQAVRHAAEVAGPLIERKHHQLIMTILGAAAYIEADPVRLEQVFVNLLTNAAKYTSDGGRIVVDVVQDAQEVAVRIADNGMGIDPDTLPRVFDLFVQGERALDRSEGGLGIGLTMVRSLVEQQGGSVTASSGGLDEGSEFVVTFPTVPMPGEGAIDSASSTDLAESMTILVVDDNVDAARMLAMLLEAAGHRTSVAHDGPTGLGAILSGRPDVAFLDIGLPGMTGYEVARATRDALGDASPTLVAYTGYGTEADHQRSKAVGFLYHLVKPVGPDEILRIAKVIARQRGETSRSADRADEGATIAE